MLLSQKMVELFGEENLVYAHPKSLYSVNILDSVKKFILSTGFPYVVSFFRFSMDFEPLSNDVQIDNTVKQLEQLFTIGCEGVTQLIGRTISPAEIGLIKSASLSDISRRIKDLNIDDAVFAPEVTLAPRICFDLKNHGRIDTILPKSTSTCFMNSSIQQLAASIIAYEANLSLFKEGRLGLENFEKEIKYIDPEALSCQKNVWASVIERLIRDQEEY